MDSKSLCKMGCETPPAALCCLQASGASGAGLVA